MSSFVKPAFNELFVHIYRTPGVDPTFIANKLAQKNSTLVEKITAFGTEYCYNVELEKPLSPEEKEKMLWILSETFEPQNTREERSWLIPDLSSFKKDTDFLVEVGPRMAFTTAWSSNCLGMFLACNITNVKRIERSRRFMIRSQENLTEREKQSFISLIHDRMTEEIYTSPLQSFDNGMGKPELVRIVPILENGKDALEALNKEKGLGFDEWDLEYYSNLFIKELNRNPTDVECFDLAQSNSEHSRHWFFSGKMVIDHEEMPETLFQMVKSTLPKQSNSVIAFHDNSSVRDFEFVCFDS
jgi:phosphoribosylformylglycinamidine synthase